MPRRYGGAGWPPQPLGKLHDGGQRPLPLQQRASAWVLRKGRRPPRPHVGLYDGCGGMVLRGWSGGGVVAGANAADCGGPSMSGCVGAADCAGGGCGGRAGDVGDCRGGSGGANVALPLRGSHSSLQRPPDDGGDWRCAAGSSTSQDGGERNACAGEGPLRMSRSWHRDLLQQFP